MVFDIETFFDQISRNTSIFKNRDILRPEFIPKILPHRDREIRRVAEILACTFKDSTPSNIFIFGKTGTGKTAVVNYVGEQLNNAMRKKGFKEINWIYINCQQVNTGYRVLSKICDLLEPENKVPIGGWPIDVLLDETISRLDKSNAKNSFIILDEIDVLVNNKRSTKGILYNLARINGWLKNTRVSLIGISNVLDFKKYLDPRVRSSLAEEEIVFPAYNASELRDILKQRADLAFEEGVLEPGVIPLCGALAAKEHGDARKALDLLRMSGELAERHGEEKITEDHVYMALEEMEKDRIKEYYNKLPLQQKVIFLSIYKLKEAGRKEIITGDVYACYSDLLERIPGLNQLSQRRVSDLIKELDLAGLINVALQSRGKYGRTKRISLNIPMEDAFSYLAEEEYFQDILNYTPRILRKKQTTIPFDFNFDIVTG